MPILEVEIVARPAERFRPALASELAEAAGLALGSEPGATWVRLRILPTQNYAEGPGAGPEVFPVFVDVLKARLPDATALQREITNLTDIFSRLCDRPRQNVHLRYQPEGLGRVAFGGTLLQR